jgi:hypothetical protein
MGAIKFDVVGSHPASAKEKAKTTALLRILASVVERAPSGRRTAHS